jgi:photosynthetic reaction center cytochrome c subunit
LATAGLTSLPDPFSAQLDAPANVRVIGKTALPMGEGPSLKQAEYTYSLMIHMSTSLGVNCTFCHNSRAFIGWDIPARVTAWHGLRLVRDLNYNYVTPLKPLYQPIRLGPGGDAPKLNCATCHRGVNKPLGGAQMLKDYPELNATALTPVAGPPPAAQ